MHKKDRTAGCLEKEEIESQNFRNQCSTVIKNNYLDIIFWLWHSRNRDAPVVLEVVN